MCFVRVYVPCVSHTRALCGTGYALYRQFRVALGFPPGADIPAVLAFRARFPRLRLFRFVVLPVDVVSTDPPAELLR